jgi:hypothetical protein
MHPLRETQAANMRTTIILVSIVLFLVFGASLFYSQHSYVQYLSLCPKVDPVGLLTRIRASFQFWHDPNDPNLSDECRAHFKRFKLAGMAAILTMILIVLFVLLVRSFGLQEVLDQ